MSSSVLGFRPVSLGALAPVVVVVVVMRVLLSGAKSVALTSCEGGEGCCCCWLGLSLRLWYCDGGGLVVVAVSVVKRSDGSGLSEGRLLDDGMPSSSSLLLLLLL